MTFLRTTLAFCLRGLTLICLAAILPALVFADPIMWFEPFIVGGQPVANGTVLGTADLGTGTVNAIGGSNAYSAPEEVLAFAPNGTLYGEYGNALYAIDTANGVDTLVGDIGPNPINDVVDMGFGPNGTLYGLDGTTDSLVTIDPTTGNATEVGALGIQNFGLGSGLAFVNGAFFTINGPDFFDGDYLYTINPATGSATSVGCLCSPADSGWLGLAVFDDTLYAALSVSPGGGPASDYVNIYTVNTSNASLSLVQTLAGTDAYAGGFPFGPETIGTTPEPSTMLPAGTGLLFLGFIAFRKARH